MSDNNMLENTQDTPSNPSDIGAADYDLILRNFHQLNVTIHKQILRPDSSQFPGNLTHLHMMFLGTLKQSSRTVTELARMLVMPKSQVTYVVDKLVEQGYAERQPDQDDRRVIHINITREGEAVLSSIKANIDQMMKKRLAVLTPEERTEMSAALKILCSLVSKI